MQRAIVRGAAAVLLICAVLAAVAALLFGTAMTSRSAVPAAALPSGAQRVSLTTADGIALAGTFWPVTNNVHAPGVLLLHGLGSSRAQFDGLGETLNDAGYAVLAINMRAHGDSGGNLRSFGLFEARDARAGMQWLKAHEGGAKTAVVGDSLGGAAAVLGAQGPVPSEADVLVVTYPDIHHAIRSRLASIMGGFLATLGEPLLSYQSWPRFGVGPEALSPLEAVRRVHAPIFVIGGDRDIFTPPAETRALYAAANAPKQLWVVKGAGHDQVGDDPLFEPRVLQFLDTTLRRSPSQPAKAAPFHRAVGR